MVTTTVNQFKRSAMYGGDRLFFILYITVAISCSQRFCQVCKSPNVIILCDTFVAIFIFLISHWQDFPANVAYVSRKSQLFIQSDA